MRLGWPSSCWLCNLDNVLTGVYDYRFWIYVVRPAYTDWGCEVFVGKWCYGTRYSNVKSSWQCQEWPRRMNLETGGRWQIWLVFLLDCYWNLTEIQCLIWGHESWGAGKARGVLIECLKCLMGKWKYVSCYGINKDCSVQSSYKSTWELIASHGPSWGVKIRVNTLKKSDASRWSISLCYRKF